MKRFVGLLYLFLTGFNQLKADFARYEAALSNLYQISELLKADQGSLENLALIEYLLVKLSIMSAEGLLNFGFDYKKNALTSNLPIGSPVSPMSVAGLPSDTDILNKMLSDNGLGQEQALDNLLKNVVVVDSYFTYSECLYDPLDVKIQRIKRMSGALVLGFKYLQGKGYSDDAIMALMASTASTVSPAAAPTAPVPDPVPAPAVSPAPAAPAAPVIPVIPAPAAPAPAAPAAPAPVAPVISAPAARPAPAAPAPTPVVSPVALPVNPADQQAAAPTATANLQDSFADQIIQKLSGTDWSLSEEQIAALKLKTNEDLTKYISMLKMLPVGSVYNKMIQDGTIKTTQKSAPAPATRPAAASAPAPTPVNPADQQVAAPAATGETNAQKLIAKGVISSVDEIKAGFSDQDLSKYVTMINVGLPDGAVKQEMVKDGVLASAPAAPAIPALAARQAPAKSSSQAPVVAASNASALKDQDIDLIGVSEPAREILVLAGDKLTADEKAILKALKDENAIDKIKKLANRLKAAGIIKLDIDGVLKEIRNKKILDSKSDTPVASQVGVVPAANGGAGGPAMSESAQKLLDYVGNNLSPEERAVIAGKNYEELKMLVSQLNMPGPLKPTSKAMAETLRKKFLSAPKSTELQKMPAVSPVPVVQASPPAPAAAAPRPRAINVPKGVAQKASEQAVVPPVRPPLRPVVPQAPANGGAGGPGAFSQENLSAMLRQRLGDLSEQGSNEDDLAEILALQIAGQEKQIKELKDYVTKGFKASDGVTNLQPVLNSQQAVELDSKLSSQPVANQYQYLKPYIEMMLEGKSRSAIKNSMIENRIISPDAASSAPVAEVPGIIPAAGQRSGLYVGWNRRIEPQTQQKTGEQKMPVVSSQSVLQAATSDDSDEESDSDWD